MLGTYGTTAIRRCTVQIAIGISDDFARICPVPFHATEAVQDCFFAVHSQFKYRPTAVVKEITAATQISSVEGSTI
jgi:hypothetical protein